MTNFIINVYTCMHAITSMLKGHSTELTSCRWSRNPSLCLGDRKPGQLSPVTTSISLECVGLYVCMYQWGILKENYLLTRPQFCNDSLFIIKASVEIVIFSPSYLDLVLLRVHDLLKSAGSHVHRDSLLASCFDKDWKNLFICERISAPPRNSV